MEAEEIIQHKEWWQLNEVERAQIAPIAADEAEYGLVKKMLQLSADASLDVPALGEHVQQQLLQEMITEKPVRRSFRWYYIAAAALLLLVAGYWIWIKPSTNNHLPSVSPEQITVVPENNPATPPPPAQEPVRVTDDSTQSSPASFNKTLVSNQPKKKKSVAIDLPKKQGPDDAGMNPYANIYTLVSSDSTLMAFVTEVY